jgi:serine/threonine-protein kinase HipA
MHLKNFAMFHTSEGLRLTPSYDQVAAAIYPEYKTLALAIGGAHNLEIGKLKPKNIITLGKEFGLPVGAIDMAYKQLLKSKERAKDIITEAIFLEPAIKQQMIGLIDKRWNGTFDLIGKSL